MLASIEKLIAGQLGHLDSLDVLKNFSPQTLTLQELCRLVERLRGYCLPVSDGLLKAGRESIDLSGTGGSGLSHFNVSTTAAFVVAAAGAKVVKFGNRAASGASGSFDFLEKLGFPAMIPETVQQSCFAETGLVFLFAGQYYPVLKQLAYLRKQVKGATIFNFIGPLLNPVRPAFRLMGVSNSHMQKLLCQYLRQDGIEKAIVVTSESGLDEIDCCSATTVLELRHGGIVESSIVPSASNCVDARPVASQDSLDVFMDIINGKDEGSEHFQRVVLNAGAGLYACNKAGSLLEGAARARLLLASGCARDKFDQLRRFYAKYVG